MTSLGQKELQWGTHTRASPSNEQAQDKQMQLRYNTDEVKYNNASIYIWFYSIIYHEY